MRRWILVLCLAHGGAWLAEAADVEFPYTAHVVSDDVYIRSGPGKDYYPTDKLQKNDTVEVHRHDPGGWCAIRPPQGSFSWVSSRYLRPIEDGLAVVTGDQVVSRVGSTFSNVRDVIQIRLERGEQVELLGEVTSGGQTWCKIGAPSGEFRWVSSKFIAADRAPRGRNTTARRMSRAPSRAAAAPAHQVDEYADDDYEAEYGEEGYATEEATEEYDDRYDDEQAAAAIDDERFIRRSRSVTPVAYDEATEEIPHRRSVRDDRGSEVETVAHNEQWRSQSAPRQVRRQPRVASLPPSARDAANRRAISPQTWSGELGDIELALSRMVAEEPEYWSFEGLNARLEQMIAVSATAIDRAKIRQMQLKVAKLESIQQRHVLADARNPVTAATRGVPGQAEAVAANAALTASGYDGEGVLRPVVSKRPDAPRFALVDAGGTVVSFVTPAPGLNLQPYLGQRVGMSGTRGFHAELKKPHVMAKRVAPLDTLSR